MKKQKSEQELKELIQKYEKQTRKNNITILNLKDELNSLYLFPTWSKLIGSCYKYENSNGSENKWYLYSRLIDVKTDKYNELYFIVNSFEKVDNKEIRINLNDVKYSDFLFKIKISEKEYNNQKDKLLKEINSL